MNIFLLDKNIIKCAKYHCDKHVVKMILEYTQMLCTVSFLNGLIIPYKPSHQKHPCTLWVGNSLDNWLWLRELTCLLNDEYKYRFNTAKNHKSFEVSVKLKIPSLPKIGLLEHPQVMPNEYKVPGNPIRAYRNFYKGSKVEFATWRKRNVPAWFIK
jgi:hypothetical protein